MWWCMSLLVVPLCGSWCGSFGGFRVEAKVVVVLGLQVGLYSKPPSSAPSPARAAPHGSAGQPVRPRCLGDDRGYGFRT